MTEIGKIDNCLGWQILYCFIKIHNMYKNKRINKFLILYKNKLFI